MTSSADKNRCARCSMVVLDVFPKIMQYLMAQTGIKAKTLYNAIMGNIPFRRNLNKSELDMIDTLQTDEYTKIDVSMSYKIIVNFFQISIPPPSRQWGANPIDTEIGIGEDIERIRRGRNTFVHKVNAYISEAQFDKFFVTFIEVGKRIDAYLNKTINNGYAHAVEQCKTCVLDPELELKLLDARADIEKLKEMYSFCLEKQGKEVHMYVAKSTEAAIAKIGEDLEEGYTKLKIIVLEVDNSEEVVTYINSLKEDLNSENINFKGAEIGSIILFIDVKNRVVLDDYLFQSNIRTLIRKIFKLCSLQCYVHTHTNAVIASAADEFDELTINLPEEGIGSCLVGEKGHVVVNIEVKNKIFRSPDSLNRTLNDFFKTLVTKGNEQHLLGKTDVYAELVKFGNTTTTEESFTQAQIPIKTNLPISVTLRKQFNTKESNNRNQYIMSCIRIGNALVFSDDARKLVICDPAGTNIHHMHLSYRPSFLAELDINTVAVCCIDTNSILIINISTRSVTSKINTNGSLAGISYKDNNLYVLNKPKTIHVMDLTGKIIRTIYLPSRFCYDITVDRDRLVFIGNTSLYCCSLDGTLIWKFKRDGGQDFRRVTTDYEGNVYVTDSRTNTVVVVSDDGKMYRTILTKSDGLHRPGGIYFDKKESILFVCIENRDENVLLFDVKKQNK